MCGICGELSANGPAVVRMNENMHDRGPDGSGVWAQGPVALGHRRLSIIDLSACGAQPMTDPELGLAIGFNGCIYNYPELRGTTALRLPLLLHQRHGSLAKSVPPLE